MISTSCRWGILGTATISRKNWQAILDSGNSRLVAVASRDRAKSVQFVAECQSAVPHPSPPLALGSYEALITHPEVDAVYIPLPTGVRKDWVIRAAQAGKHVLVEKPVGCTVADVSEMIAVCEKYGVQFMDGVMFMHTERLKKMRAVLDDASSVGRIRRITTQFSFHADEEFISGNIRTHRALEPQGCLGDLGWYCIRFSLWAMGWRMPRRVTGRILAEAGQPAADGAVPLEFSGELLFDGGASAGFFCSFVAENQQWGVVSGDKGFLRVPDFVLPFKGGHTRYSVTNSDFQLDGCQFDMIEGRRELETAEPSSNAPRSQEANLFHRFSEIVLSKKLDPHWPKIALQTQTVMDACLESARDGSAAREI
ncbi:MAG: Gfo/Idh/MocA family oxidoreductase [Verrucomicrobiaceae bacterium]|nr:Gfo/Idh/MocA family oxidoreductase [Verrucomicrobiaceae bacterium]